MLRKSFSFLAVAALLPALLAAAPGSAAEPEQLNLPSFSVSPVTADGGATDQYGSKDIPHFDMRFALALSATKTYSVRITLIQDANGSISETTLYEGSLPEGNYRFLAAGAPPPGFGEIKAKVVMRVRMFTKKFTGDDFYAYRQWEGMYRYGK